MKSFFRYALALLFFIISLSFKVYASENQSILDESKIIIANKYAERFCSTKVNHYFEGLENEKTLKNSYFKYIGLHNQEIYSTDMHQILINQIRDKCFITNEEEREINEFISKK